MQVLHKGFDGLDVSFQSQISDCFYHQLLEAQEEAAKNHQPTLLELGATKMHVTDSGSKGGYKFRCDTGPDGETWFFKKPNPRDPWGIRVSVKSLSLALYGLGGVRARIFEFMEAIGAPYKDGAESIGRVDYCIDLLIPGFQLIPENFVMHSNCTRTDNHEMEVYGKSGKVTGVRIGKMPGRQVAVYDKRADIVAKRKVEWWEIWNANLKADDLPLLNPDNREQSQVWRVELRAGKKHLKGKWNIRKWADLDDKLGDVLLHSLETIRYCNPSLDSNRARWELDLLWKVVRHELQKDLFEMACNASPALVKEVIRSEHIEMLGNQLIGLATSLAAAKGMDKRNLDTYPNDIKNLVKKCLCENEELFHSKIAKAEKRYVFITP
jgi:hypothetical protein